MILISNGMDKIINNIIFNKKQHSQNKRKTTLNIQIAYLNDIIMFIMNILHNNFVYIIYFNISCIFLANILVNPFYNGCFFIDRLYMLLY